MPVSRLLAVLALLAAPCAAQVRLAPSAILPTVPVPVIAAPAVQTALSLATALTPAGLTPVLPAAVAAPSPVFSAVPAAAQTSYVVREGVDERGRKVLGVDALIGTEWAGHIDVLIQGPGLPAVLDGEFRRSFAADPAWTRTGPGLGLFVSPAFRGRGIGDALMARAAELAVREGARELVIYATESSRGFYVAHFAGKVLGEETFTGADESIYHRLSISL